MAKKVLVKLVNFDLCMFFNSDLSDRHCNEYSCLKKLKIGGKVKESIPLNAKPDPGYHMGK